MIRPRFWRGRSDYFFFRAAFLAFFAFLAIAALSDLDAQCAVTPEPLADSARTVIRISQESRPQSSVNVCAERHRLPRRTGSACPQCQAVARPHRPGNLGRSRRRSQTCSRTTPSIWWATGASARSDALNSPSFEFAYPRMDCPFSDRAAGRVQGPGTNVGSGWGQGGTTGRCTEVRKFWSEWQDLNLRPLRPERSGRSGKRR
jgi:hypothetical protein